jgi:hypothetical protein
MIQYRVTVRAHERPALILEDELVSGNTSRTAQAAKAAMVRSLDWQYPPDLYEIRVARVREGGRS